MERRDFLRTAGGATAVGVAGGTATAAPAVAQTDGNKSGGNKSGGNKSGGNKSGGKQSSGGKSAGGGTKEVKVGPGGENKFEPQEVTVPPGTTVKWSWESDNHNIVVENQPEKASWKGTKGSKSKTYNTGHTYQHTFETTGTYEYFCDPHKQMGMTGTVEVKEGASLDKGGGGGEGGGQKKPEEMGVPFRAHYVGIAAILAIIITLVFTFFQLKYGESPHASGGGN